MNQLTDKFERKVSYLRVSVTDRCNLRCRYCAPHTPFTLLNHDEILQYEEILRIVRVSASFGISKIRVTGGEPLVRRDVCSFLDKLNRIPGINDVSITTNGVLLTRYLNDLKCAGIKRINISLDSMDRRNFDMITQRDYFERVWEGVQQALEMGFNPVKINVVAMRGVNDHEFIDFARLSINYPLHIRFIEYMPVGISDMDKGQQILTPEIMEQVSVLGDLEPIRHQANDGPAFRYRFPNAKGEIGFISPISRHFCLKCNRLRLTANGMIRSCLLSDYQVDIKTPLRSGISDDQIRGIFLDALNHKGRAHAIGSAGSCEVTSQMSSIGG